MLEKTHCDSFENFGLALLYLNVIKQKCDVIQYYDYFGFNYLTAKLLIIYIQTYGTLSKNAIKTKIWHLVIDGTETRFSVFSLKCLTLIVNYKEFFKCYTCNTQKLGQRQNKSNTVLESVLRLGIKGAFTERISFCKQGWVGTHHFVPNFGRETRQVQRQNHLRWTKRPFSVVRPVHLSAVFWEKTDMGFYVP